MLLSVIIPIYNAETYIDRCVSSIVGQSYTDMQIILVDDGSTDGSADCCDRWARQDKRIEVVHKTNGGLSDARNQGIDRAKGELITFVDADDFLAPDTYSRVIADMAPDIDLIEYPIFRHYGSPRQAILSFAPQIYDSARDYWLDCRAYDHTYACNKIYRRRTFCQVRFPVGKIFEDALTLPVLLNSSTPGHPRRIATTDKGLYYYCANPSGITATAHGNGLSTLLQAHLGNPYLKEDPLYYLHVLNIQMDVYEQTGAPPMLPSIQLRHLSRVNPRMRIKAFLVRTLGIYQLCKLNKVLHQIRKKLPW